MKRLAIPLVLLLLPGPWARAEPTAEPPLLTLDEAVSIAMEENRLLKGAAFEVGKSDDRLGALRTRRLPQFKLDVIESRLLSPIDFTFQRGTFGTFPPIGPVPPAETKIRTPAHFATYLLGSVNQPLTQQYRIGLGLELLELGRDLAKEGLRRERQRTRSSVRAAYYRLAATQSAIAASRNLVRALREMDQLSQRHLREQTVLRTDALEVKSRLAREEWRLLSAENGLASQREHLNQLLGRDLGTSFRVAEPSNLAGQASTPSLEEARRLALVERAELREAHLKRRQADTDLRLARAEWIPDLTLSFRYLALHNVAVLPEQVTDVGLYLSWEPFDWGRRNRVAAEKAKTVAQAQLGADEAAEQIAVEVGLRWRKAEEANKLLEANRFAIEAAQENLQTVLNRYREEAKVLRDLLQAQAQLSGAEHEYGEALAGYWTAVAELERAIGNE